MGTVKGHIVNTFVDSVRRTVTGRGAASEVKKRDEMRARGMSDYILIFDEAVELADARLSSVRIPLSQEEHARNLGGDNDVCAITCTYEGETEKQLRIIDMKRIGPTRAEQILTF